MPKVSNKKNKNVYFRKREELKNMLYIFNRVKEQVQKRFIGQIREIMITTKPSSNVQIMKL